MINKNNLLPLFGMILSLMCVPATQNAFAYNNEHLSREESLVKDIQPFNKYGLTYNKQEDIVYYNGEAVKAFVDFKEPNWAFNIGYFSGIDNGLYLVSIHNDDDEVIGIEKMSQSLIEELYGDMDKSQKKDEDNHKEYTDEESKEKLASIAEKVYVNKNSAKNYNKKNTDKYTYRTFDATTVLSDSSIVVTDKLDNLDVPDSVKQLVSDYSNTKKAALITFENDNEITGWLCYGGDNRLAWNAETDKETLKLYLFDFENNNTDRDYTLIHYKAPIEYKNLEIYLNDVELELDKLIIKQY